MKTSSRALRSFWRWAGHQEVISVVFQGPRSRRFSVWRGNRTLDMLAHFVEYTGTFVKVWDHLNNNQLIVDSLSLIGKFLVCWQEQVCLIKTSKHLRGLQGFYWRLVAPPPPWTACPGCSSWQGRSATWLRSRFSITYPGNPELREIYHTYVLGYCVLAEELHGT